MTIAPEFTPAARARLTDLADALIPAAEGMPSASEANVSNEEIDRVMASRPDLHGRLAMALDEPGKPAEALARLATRAPATFEALTVAVFGAYYMNREVRKRLRYPGQQARPISEHHGDDIWALLEPVIQGGPIYRVPTQQ